MLNASQNILEEKDILEVSKKWSAEVQEKKKKNKKRQFKPEWGSFHLLNKNPCFPLG